jgi:hypothetical protein
MEEQEMTDDIVRDITELLTSMCARLYGKRSAAHRARKALHALHALHDEPHDEPIAGDAALRPTSANDVSLK